MKTSLIRSAAVTDPGNVRGNNEDRVHADAERGIYAVIDGVGGEAGGERAAAIAEEELLARLARNTGTVEDRLREGIALAARRIVEHARLNPELAGMSCVLTVAVLQGGEAVIGHVGDTRLYKLRAGKIEKITRDHSPVGIREDAGEISEREAMNHPRRNEIFRDVGSAERSPQDPEFVEIHHIAVEPDAALLLCSDGLTDQVASAEILETVRRCAGDPARVARELIRQANQAGGKDNVSVVYLEGPKFAAPSGADTTRPGRPRTRLWIPVLASLLAGLLLGSGLSALRFRRWLETQPKPPRILVVTPAATEGQFSTVVSALAEARPGDTVEVRPGTYREQVLLKSGVNVVARPAGQAVIDAVADASQPGAALIAQNVSSGSVSGLRIVLARGGPIATGVLVSDSTLELTDLEIEGATLSGILVRGSSKPVIRGSHIHDNSGAGVTVQNQAEPHLAGNIIAANGTRREAPRAGLEIAAVARPTVHSNVFAANGRAVLWENAPDREKELLARNRVIAAPAQRRPAPAAAERGAQ